MLILKDQRQSGRGYRGRGREEGGRLSCHSIPPHTTAGMQHICMIMCSLPVVSFLALGNFTASDKRSTGQASQTPTSFYYWQYHTSTDKGDSLIPRPSQNTHTHTHTQKKRGEVGRSVHCGMLEILNHLSLVDSSAEQDPEML